MAARTFVFDPKKKALIPEKWTDKQLRLIRDAGDHKLVIQRLLKERWKDLAPAWDKGAQLVISVDEAVVQYELVAPSGRKDAKTAINALAVPVKSRQKSSGFDPKAIEDLENAAREVEDKKTKPAVKVAPLKEFVVLTHPDLVRLVDDRALLKRSGLKGPLPIEVKITNTKALKQLSAAGDLVLLQQQVKDAADWDAVKKGFSDLVRKLVELVEKDPQFLKQVDKIAAANILKLAEEAADRTLAELARIRKMKLDRGVYAVKTGLKLGVTFAGLAISVAAVGTSIGIAAGTEGGATPVAIVGIALGVLGALKASVSIFEQVVNVVTTASKVADDANAMVEKLQADGNGILSAIDKKGLLHQMKDIGVDSAASALGVPMDIVSLITPAFASLKQTEGKVGLLGTKIDAVEIRTTAASKKVTSQLKSVQKMSALAGKWVKGLDLKKLTRDQSSKIQALLKQIRAAEGAVDAVIQATIGAALGLSGLRKTQGRLTDQLKELRKKQPKVFRLASFTLPVLSNLAVALAGLATMDASSFGTAVSAAASSLGLVGNAIDSLTALVDLGDGLKSTFG